MDYAKERRANGHAVRYVWEKMSEIILKRKPVRAESGAAMPRSRQ